MMKTIRMQCFVSSSQLGWVKRATWLEAVIAGPGRPRGRLPNNWVQRIAVQQAQASGELIKIPKKRGPKPGSKVRVNRSSSLNHITCISMRTHRQAKNISKYEGFLIE